MDLEKFDIRTIPDNCTGCLRCELACSDLHTKRFALSEARIRIELDREQCTISFSRECRRCGICADHCLYGALLKVSRGEGK